MCIANSVGTGRDLSVPRMVITNGNYIMANVTANRGFKITIGIGGLRRDGSRGADRSRPVPTEWQSWFAIGIYKSR